MAQICYSHHPFCGQTVEIVRGLRRQPAESLVVKLPEGVQIAIAAWMLAPLACRPLPDTPPPCVRVDALLALRDVLDPSLVLHITAPAPAGASQRQGGRAAPEPSPPPPCLRRGGPGPLHPAGSSVPRHNASRATTSWRRGARPWRLAPSARSLAMREQIRPTQLPRTASVSVRQSRPQHVRAHHESPRCPSA
jgi:hypothetical protein